MGSLLHGKCIPRKVPICGLLNKDDCTKTQKAFCYWTPPQPGQNQGYCHPKAPSPVVSLAQAPFPAQTIDGHLGQAFAAEKGVQVAMSTELVKNFLWMLNGAGKGTFLNELKIPTHEVNKILKNLGIPFGFNTTELSFLPPFDCLAKEFPNAGFDIWIHAGLDDVEIKIAKDADLTHAVYEVNLPNTKASLQIVEGEGKGATTTGLVFKCPLSFNLTIDDTQKTTVSGKKVAHIVPQLSDMKLTLEVDPDATPGTCKNASDSLLSMLTGVLVPVVGDLLDVVLKDLIDIPDELELNFLEHHTLRLGDIKLGGIPKTDTFDGAVTVSVELEYADKNRPVPAPTHKCSAVPADGGGLCYCYVKGYAPSNCCRKNDGSTRCEPFYPLIPPITDGFHGHPRNRL
jgi:hypothetical protein